jgi:hypothetical protein
MSTEDKRVHNNLRALVDKACQGVMPHIAERIQDAARRAYYLGCEDGLSIQRDTKEQDNEETADTYDAALAERIG